MADLDSFIGLDHLAEFETGQLIINRSYQAQHWGVRTLGGNVGFGVEVPQETLLDIILLRIDPASKPKTDWVALTASTDIRTGDKFVLFLNGKRRKLEVSAVHRRGSTAEVELKNG